MGLGDSGHCGLLMIYFGDVDVVVKLATCGFLPLLPSLLDVEPADCQIRYLGSLKSRVRRANKRLANPEFQKHLETFCDTHLIAESGAGIEREQELLMGGMDPGEARLFAEAEASGGIIVTGDKRALAAYFKLSSTAQRAKIKVVCFEQLLLRIHALYGYERLKQGCCAGIDCDRGLFIAFSNGLATQEAHTLAALDSCMRELQSHSADILLVFSNT